MKNLQIAKLLISPSFTSFLAVSTIAVLVQILVGWQLGQKTGIIYEYLLGSQSSAREIEVAKTTFDALNNTVLGNPELNKALFFIFWAFVGLVIYLIVSGISSSIGAMLNTVNEYHSQNIRKGLLAHRITTRIILRLMIFLLLIMFTYVFLSVFLPVSLLSTKIGFVNLATFNGLMYIFLSFFIIVASLHVLVILLRLFMLRLRLYAGDEDILLAKYDS